MMNFMDEQDKQDEQGLPFKDVLAEAMQKRGVSIAKLAGGTGLSRQTIHMYLNGGRPTLENCLKLAAYLNVSWRYFFKSLYPNTELVRSIALTQIYSALPEKERRILERMAQVLLEEVARREVYPKEEEMEEE